MGFFSCEAHRAESFTWYLLDKVQTGKRVFQIIYREAAWILFCLSRWSNTINMDAGFLQVKKAHYELANQDAVFLLASGKKKLHTPEKLLVPFVKHIKCNTVTVYVSTPWPLLCFSSPATQHRYLSENKRETQGCIIRNENSCVKETLPVQKKRNRVSPHSLEPQHASLILQWH